MVCELVSVRPRGDKSWQSIEKYLYCFFCRLPVLNRHKNITSIYRYGGAVFIYNPCHRENCSYVLPHAVKQYWSTLFIVMSESQCCVGEQFASFDKQEIYLKDRLLIRIENLKIGLFYTLCFLHLLIRNMKLLKKKKKKKESIPIFSNAEFDALHMVKP